MTDSAELVHRTVDGHTHTLTLDSPANRNALSRRLVAELMAGLDAAAGDPDSRVVVVTHTGTTFCAGADLAEAIEFGMEDGTRSLLALLRRIVSLSVPVVALVRGHVRAGGVGLVGACDVALTSTDASYAFTESLLGLAPAIISLTTRSRLGDRDAARLYLTGARFDGAEAARIGLVTTAVSEPDLDPTLARLLSEFAQVSPQGLRETKALLNGPVLDRIDAEGERLTALSTRLFASAQAREGMAAFKEHRPPFWVTS
ncbi:MAG: enoyl-CoA hydratase family protein [Nocardioidaceae bacterium]